MRNSYLKPLSHIVQRLFALVYNKVKREISNVIQTYTRTSSFEQQYKLLKRTVGRNKHVNRCVRIIRTEYQDKMHIQEKFKSHLDFSWFVPKRRFVLPFIPPILSFCLGLSHVGLTPAQSPFLSLFSSSIVHSRRLSPPPSLDFSLPLSPLFLSRDGFPSGSGRATSSSLLPAASRNHSRWNRG